MGKAKNLKERVSSYFTNKHILGDKTSQMVAKIHTIDITIVDSEFESLLLEAHYIKKFQPKYNALLTDDKAYPLIRITIKQQYPAVLTARRKDDKRSIYFGPFPSASSVRLVLRLLRRIFPFQTTLSHPKRVCLYNHLGLCPCAPAFDIKEVTTAYRKNIRHIIRVLEGKSHAVKRELEKEMKTFGKQEQFEEAKEIKRQLDALQYVIQPFHRPYEYETNPNLRIDIRAKELESLRNVLGKNGLLIDDLARIECYDISNIQGTYATGSLVVLTHGEIDKSQYRKFQIRKQGSPNDVAMMTEVLQRRILHKEWKMPDLIVVDGGKGQVGAATDVLEKFAAKIPVIGLAKREETIVIQKKNVIASPAKRDVAISEIASSSAKPDPRNDSRTSFVEVLLPNDSPALHLIQRIRDEAHRFAITYHKKLRRKSISG